MDFFTGFNNLAPSIKTILLAILVKMPFWYFAIVVFSGSFAEHYPFYIHLVAAFCLTMAWLYGTTIAILMIYKASPKVNEEEDKHREILYYDATFLTLPILCFAAFFTYIMSWHFMDYLYIAFGLLMSTILLGIIIQMGNYLLAKIKKSRQK